MMKLVNVSAWLAGGYVVLRRVAVLLQSCTFLQEPGMQISRDKSSRWPANSGTT